MLMLHRAWRGDRLADGLARVLSDPPADPFAAEVVCVPTRGVERWLTQQLSTSLGAMPGRQDGVCANVEFPFPGAVVAAAAAAATGVDPEADPWTPARSVWPLLGVVDESLGEPWLRPLACHLGHGSENEDGEDRSARRFSAVRHLADLFDRYGVHRPSLLEAWARGGATMPPSLGADVAWQAELWRRLRERIGAPSPAERLSDACARLVSEPALATLPERFSLFGLTRLPASYLDVLVALSAHRDVHLWLLHPSPALWDRLAASRLHDERPWRRDDERICLPARNPLLRSWGRDATEMQIVAGAAGASGGELLDDDAYATVARPVASPTPGHQRGVATLLELLQGHIRADVEPPGGGSASESRSTAGADDPRPLLGSDDRSIVVHSCHGRARQVEVLRDAVAHLLDEDPTLEARDVIVMCPDIEAFASLVHATFGQAGAVVGADLQVRLADRSLRQTNPVLGALTRLLEMADARVTASDLLDLAGLPPLRAKFGFDDDELSRLGGWAGAAGVRWGLDAAWRAPYGLGKLDYATWASGLDRILLGVAVADDPIILVAGVLPVDDVDSGDIHLAGKLAELVQRVGTVLASFKADQSLSSWVASIEAAADSLFAAPRGEEWQVLQLHRMLDEVLSQAADGSVASATALRPAELRALLADRLRGVPTRANFRTGHLTMCSLVPMRSVPHRVVCLLGMDDGAFPRRCEPDSDDLLAAEPWVGDRDARSEDLQLLLDAVLAAGEKLLVVYSGHDERSNAPRPPAVPVAELLDVAERTVRVGQGSLRDCLVVEHPLQTFDPRNFEPGALVPRRPWSFERAALAGAEAARRVRRPPPARFSQVLPPLRDDPIAVDDLIAFVEHPVKAFLRKRLGISVSARADDSRDAMVMSLDALEGWKIGDRLVRASLAGVSLERAVEAEHARQSLPPGRLGERSMEEIVAGVQSLLMASRPPDLHPHSFDVTVALPGGLTVVGTVGEVFGTELRSVTYSRLGPKQRLVSWVRLLALSAAMPGTAWTSRAIGRARGAAGARTASIPAIGADPAERGLLAREKLHVIVDLYLRGMREPLPLALKTSAAWAAAERASDDFMTSARREWESSWKWPHEDDDPAHLLVHGRRLPWEEFVAATPAPDEEGDGWGRQSSRAGRLANRLWAGVLAAEDLG